MDCSQFKSDLSAFREGTQPAEMHDLCEQHLSSCRACSRLVSEFDKVDMLIEQVKAAEPNPFAATRILQRLENEVDTPQKRYPVVWVRVLRPAAIAVALLCGILIGSYTAKNDAAPLNQVINTTGNIDFLRSNLFISEFADEDKILVINN